MTPSPFEQLATAFEAIVRQAVADALAEALPATADSRVLLSVQEAATRAGVSTTTMKREIAAGHLRSSLVGRRRLVHVADLAAYAATLGQAI